MLMGLSLSCGCGGIVGRQYDGQMVSQKCYGLKHIGVIAGKKREFADLALQKRLPQEALAKIRDQRSQ